MAHKLILTLWALHLATRWYMLLISRMKHSQITQSNNVPNPCNLSKKLGMESIFCMQISKNWHYRFWWKQQISRLVIFLQHIKKKVFCFLITASVFYCDVKHLDMGSVMFVVTCFWVIVVKNGSCPLYHETKIWYIYIYIYIYICYITDITFTKK